MPQSGTFLCHHKNFIKSENSTVIFLQVWRPANHSYELHVKPQIMAPLITWLWRSIVLRVTFFKVIIIQNLYCRFRVSKYAWISKRRLQNIMRMIIIMMITIIITIIMKTTSLGLCVTCRFHFVWTDQREISVCLQTPLQTIQLHLVNPPVRLKLFKSGRIFIERI